MMSGGYKQLLNNAYREAPTLDVGKVYSIEEEDGDEVPLFQQNRTIIQISNDSRYSERDPSSSSDCCIYFIILFVTFLVVFGTFFIKNKWGPHE